MSDKPTSKRPAWRPLAGAVAGGALLITAGFGVWASLSATAFNTTPESVGSGTLSLNLGDNGAGFTAAISNMAPGDVVNRYVDLTNNGTLDAQGLTLAVAAGGSNALITDGTSPATTKALKISVNQCSTSWTTSSGVCSASGTVTSLLSSTTVSALSSAASLVSGAVAHGAVLHLQVSMLLPDQAETTVNGAVPGTTIQGQTATLTYTFADAQRDPGQTNS
jgi:hypothetical protein